MTDHTEPCYSPSLFIQADTEANLNVSSTVQTSRCRSRRSDSWLGRQGLSWVCSAGTLSLSAYTFSQILAIGRFVSPLVHWLLACGYSTAREELHYVHGRLDRDRARSWASRTGSRCSSRSRWVDWSWSSQHRSSVWGSTWESVRSSRTRLCTGTRWSRWSIHVEFHAPSLDVLLSAFQQFSSPCLRSGHLERHLSLQLCFLWIHTWSQTWSGSTRILQGELRC